MTSHDEPAGLLDPVAAYDRIATNYSLLASRRRAYLRTVDRLIVRNIPAAVHSYLDVGSGDARRALHIAGASGAAEVTLAEPSAAMRALWPSSGITEAWPIRAEELAEHLGERAGTFNVITCLWNVLGHIPSGRAEVLRTLAGLLEPSGVLFVDVNHRYNASHYGYFPTTWRFLRDLVTPSERNGDVVAEWELFGEHTRTFGHVFTHREFRGLCRSAGLRLEKRFVIDYGTGAVRRASRHGNLLYVLRRSY